ncbi:hypothetical protein [Roseateles saccharophilus]|jgi:hypothetical protein|uniref:Uncharacterized protein n=1 Tax=Roseateles saccharophilus TaxID=304 RepID=A0A4R3URQ2_ROSSA|nr:hypothetical protein [Roseateles saccharophilus]MDG0833140.1 hypothetical protein [Roseateles saccharophilus]TCU94606.1 hypothetical protein EV671_101628 [Roseateles saccharophilus]
MTEISTRQRVAVACAMLATALSATAQAQPPNPAASAVQAAPGQRGDPTDARSDVPLLVYRSPLQGYRPYADTEPASWVETNKTVATVGGWRVYAKEARQPDAPDAASAPASGTKSDAKPDAGKPQPAGHAGHKMK